MSIASRVRPFRVIENCKLRLVLVLVYIQIHTNTYEYSVLFSAWELKFRRIYRKQNKPWWKKKGGKTNRNFQFVRSNCLTSRINLVKWKMINHVGWFGVYGNKNDMTQSKIPAVTASIMGRMIFAKKVIAKYNGRFYRKYEYESEYLYCFLFAYSQ